MSETMQFQTTFFAGIRIVTFAHAYSNPYHPG